jgi:Lipocalin-like domain
MKKAAKYIETRTMNRIISAIVTASALVIGILLAGEEAVAQTAKDLVGTWTLVSITLEQDGNKTDFYGPNPKGQLTYDANGRFSEILTRSDLPKFASNNRIAGTAEENKAIVQGSLAQFGTYSVSETDKIITRHIESCTFANWNGTERQGSFSISGDKLNYTSLSGTSTGTATAYLVWKRVK